MTTTTTEHELNRMGLRDLQNRFHEVVGEATRCPNKTFLIRRILASLNAHEAGANDAAVPAANQEFNGPPSNEPPVAEPSVAESTVAEAIVEDPPSAEPPALADANAEPEEEAPATVIEPAPATEAIPPRLALAEDDAPLHDKQPHDAPAVDAGEDAPASNAAEGAPAEPAPLTSVPAAASSPTQPARGRRGRFRDMTVEQMQALYLSTVGRASSSTDRRYLEWKIREAEKGRIPVGPREQRAAEHEASDDIRVLPLRLDGAAVDALDATWKSHGMKSRMDFFRRALGHYLAHLGANGAAMHFASQSAE